MYEKWQKKLENVTWGYRGKFENSLESIVDKGRIDINRHDQKFRIFDEIFMKLVGEDYGKDHGANYFLEALDNKYYWLLSRPELFKSFGEYGLKLIDIKLSYGIRYFKIWHKKLNINDYQEMQFVMNNLSKIENMIDTNTALAFLEGYEALKVELKRSSIQKFVDEGIDMFENKPQNATKYFFLETSLAKKMVKIISKRCYLKDIKPRLERLYISICGKETKIETINKLDSDELIEKNSKTVAFYNSLYLPTKVSLYNKLIKNTKWYLASAYTNACAQYFKGFPIAHGIKGFESSKSFLETVRLENDIISVKLFYLLDVMRIYEKAFKMFPGIREIIFESIQFEMSKKKEENYLGIFDIILFRSLFTKELKRVTDKRVVDTIDNFREEIKGKLEICETFYDIKDIIKDTKESFLKYFKPYEKKYGLQKGQLSFYSDYEYTASLSTPSIREEQIIEDLSKSKKNTNKDKKAKKIKKEGYSDEIKTKDDKEKIDDVANQFYYDEWNNDVGDYLPNWCMVNEVVDFDINNNKNANDLLKKDQINEVKRLFEMIKPDLMEKYKNLITGDDIILDSMVNYLVEKKAKLNPEGKIYSKDYKDQRDIACLLLIDTSGSTEEKVNDEKLIEIEKKAAFLLSEGLKQLGDKFGIFGFSSSGKEKCSFYLFKDFNEKWEDKQKQRVLNCKANGTTRIGVAIRHATNKLKKLDNKDKLLIIITDGKPQDNDGYTSTRFYAQHDVKMSTIEAKKEGINVFCISTQNDSIDELEIMFPVKKYVVIKDISMLPKLLTDNYIKLTK